MEKITIDQMLVMSGEYRRTVAKQLREKDICDSEIDKSGKRAAIAPQNATRPLQYVTASAGDAVSVAESAEDCAKGHYSGSSGAVNRIEEVATDSGEIRASPDASAEDGAANEVGGAESVVIAGCVVNFRIKNYRHYHKSWRQTNMLSVDENVSKLFTEGGDDRLHLSEAGINKYYCAPRPLERNVIKRSSCTCSAPTRAGFEAAKKVFESLGSGAISFDDAMRDVEKRLSKVLKLNESYEIVFHPSGSDAELIPLAVAMHRAERLKCDTVISVVVAAGEVGTGTAPAAGGRHFSKFAPDGTIVESGALVDAAFKKTQVVELKPRLADGSRNDDYDSLVRNAVEQAHSENASPFIVLHAVDGSKTGLRLPSKELIMDLQAKYGERILLCLDACQGRSEPTELKWFLERGGCGLVTASKFYSAPGFCGAVVLPKEAASDLECMKSFPAGFKYYLSRFDIPTTMPVVRNQLGDWQNMGLLMRWVAGICEMELFDENWTVSRKLIATWVQGVQELIRKHEPYLELIDQSHIEDANGNTRIGGVNSVVSFKVMGSGEVGFLCAAILKKVHKLLTKDSSNLLPGGATEAERKACSVICMVGQPVNLGDFSVLRIAAGAPMARELAVNGVDAALSEDKQIVEKLITVAKYIHSM